MGTKCCWKENKDNSENQTDVDVKKSDVKKKEVKILEDKKNVNNIKRKSYPLQNKKDKGGLKKEDSAIDVLDKRSSTASFHSATSCNESSPVSNPTNSDISSKYQG